MKRIVVRIKGGLGNQMFQYAAARAFVEENKDYQLILDTYDTKDSNERPLGLREFRLNEKVVFDQMGHYEKYNRANNLCLRIGMKLIPSFILYLASKRGLYLWDEDKVIRFDNKRRFIYLNGYWQSESYFKMYSDTIKKEFVAKHSLPVKYKSLIDEIKTVNSVCIHIRLGDYLKKENSYLRVCDADYYISSIKRIKKLIDVPFFYVFSDNLDEARILLRSCTENINYVNTESAFFDFEIMRCCKNFVISNSTFSWWAQYLATHENKIIIAPSKWTRAGTNKSIYLENWLLE